MDIENEIEDVSSLVEMTKDFVKRNGGSQEQADICGRVLERQPEGSVCIEISQDEANLLEGLPLVSVAPDDSGLFIVDGSLLYTRRNWKYEQYVKQRILEMATHGLYSAIEIPSDGVYAKLKACQRKGLEMMCTRHFSILTGGPGTGKTYTIARAVKLMLDKDSKMKIGLAAPTGKASARVGEAMEQQVKELQLGCELKTLTIKKLLEANYDFVTFKRNQDNPLDLKWLIVDEASMIDLPLMAKMLQALPADCRLTLVGDANQLASVEMGRVFGDLCRMPQLASCIAMLNESTRFPQGGEIDRLSEAVKNGDSESALRVLHDPGNALIHSYKPTDSASLEAKIQELFGERFAWQTSEEGALETINDCRILCAVRRGPYGCEKLNAKAMKLLGEKCPVPVMITKNNSSLDVSNGDVGVVMPGKDTTFWLSKGKEGKVSLPMELLPYNETAFATTIHKSQGSEYQDVIIVLPPIEESGKAISLLTREILYTAITRTVKQVFIFADDETIRRCCENEIQRVTGLK